MVIYLSFATVWLKHGTSSRSRHAAIIEQHTKAIYSTDPPLVQNKIMLQRASL